MKRLRAVPGMLLLLAATSAHAQFSDSFTTPKFGPAWSFAYGTSNTENPTNFTTGSGAFNVTLKSGIVNWPSVTVAPNAPADYDIYLTVNGNFGTVANGYSFAGLEIYADTQNFIQIGSKYNPNGGTGSGYVYANSYMKISNAQVGAFDNLFGYGDITSAPITYRISKTGTIITISISTTGNAGPSTPLNTVTSGDPDAFKAAAYALLSNLSGKKIAIFNNSDVLTPTVTFTNFATTLPIVKPAATDPFTGPKLNPTWSFAQIPGAGTNNETAANYTAGNGMFTVKTVNSAFGGANAYIQNCPYVTVSPTYVTGDCVIEAAVVENPYLYSSSYKGGTQERAYRIVSHGPNILLRHRINLGTIITKSIEAHNG